MVLRYSKLFTVTGAITLEPVTIRVECIKAEGFLGVSIESLEGEYSSPDDFDKASGIGEDKIHNFLPMKLPDARMLVDALNEALEASEETSEKEAA
uniref:Uncharacterized protein n=1 Tax=viral metagenome TaxID=1070528 RepID=A0A6M3M587_9ZZZZ